VTVHPQSGLFNTNPQHGDRRAIENLCAVRTDRGRRTPPRIDYDADRHSGRRKRQGFPVDTARSVTTRRRAKSTPEATPSSEYGFFGPPPLIPGESRADYDAFLAAVTASVKPVGVLEEMWVREAVDHHWVVLRLRRLNALLLQGHAHQGVANVMNRLKGVSTGGLIASNWARNEPGARKEVSDRLAAAGLTFEAVMAETLALKLEETERIDYLMSSAEERRNTAIHEIDRRREAFKAAASSAVEAEEAEFNEVAIAGGAPPRGAAQ
jgi:hypothetical protein